MPRVLAMTEDHGFASRREPLADDPAEPIGIIAGGKGPGGGANFAAVCAADAGTPRGSAFGCAADADEDDEDEEE
jgi:hypothetical protein